MYQPGFYSRFGPDAGRGAQGPQESLEENGFPWLRQTPSVFRFYDNDMAREINVPVRRTTIHERPPRASAPSPPPAALSPSRIIDFYPTQELDLPRRVIHERPRMVIAPPPSPPRFVDYSTREIDSRLTQDEQKKALKQLKLETYNPPQKSLSKKWCLYYRDQAQNIVKDSEKGRDEDGKRCAVCLDDFAPKESVMVTPCKHMFHEECIVPWVKSHGQCPVCRFAICERMGQNNRSMNNNNFANLAANDLYAGELISIIRSMEEAFIWNNRRH